MPNPLHYDTFQELLKFMDINPFEFRNYSDGFVVGYFPDLPERTGNKAKKLAKLVWKGVA